MFVSYLKVCDYMIVMDNLIIDLVDLIHDCSLTLPLTFISFFCIDLTGLAFPEMEM